MAKFSVLIGYIETAETEPGIWVSQVKEKAVKCDRENLYKHFNQESKVNANISLNFQISFIADPYFLSNYANIRYAKFLGTAWSVSSIEPQHPRLILNLGGVYNGEQA